MKDDPDTPLAGTEQITEPITPTPRSSASPELEERFRQLAEQWKQESLYMSSPAAMERLPSYQQIIALGPAVVPLMLREMEQSPTFWFGALHVLTRADPIPPEHAGRIKAMTQDWVTWGREQGYRW